MQALGLPLIPPPPVDLEAVPLDRLRPRRPPGPAGTAATAGGSRRQRSLLAVSACGRAVWGWWQLGWRCGFCWCRTGAVRMMAGQAGQHCGAACGWTHVCQPVECSQS